MLLEIKVWKKFKESKLEQFPAKGKVTPIPILFVSRSATKPIFKFADSLQIPALFVTRPDTKTKEGGLFKGNKPFKLSWQNSYFK